MTGFLLRTCFERGSNNHSRDREGAVFPSVPPERFLAGAARNRPLKHGLRQRLAPRRGLIAGGTALLTMSMSAVGRAQSTSPAPGVFEPLASLREQPDRYNGDLRLAAFEPPGGEELLRGWITQLETLLDDELDLCVQAGVLLPLCQRDQDVGGRKAFAPEGRLALLAEAEKVGCKARKKTADKPSKIDALTKRYRKDVGKLPTPIGEADQPPEADKYLASGYDAAKFGALDPSGLWRLERRRELQAALLDLAEEYFLVPVQGDTDGVTAVDDWRLRAESRKPFNGTIKIGPGKEVMIQDIVSEQCLIGTDDTFKGVSAGSGNYAFEGSFLYSRQILQDNDVTTTVVLVKRPEFDPLVARVRDLVQDYARIRLFRIAELAKCPFLYVAPEYVAKDLMPAAADILKNQQDPARLEALQEHFFAPKAGRTRTKDWKAIEWTGPLTSLNENLDVEMKVESGADNPAAHRLAFNAAGTPLAEQALDGKLKLGQEVTLVAKVVRLDYDGSGTAGALLFTLEPLIGERQMDGADPDRPTKTQPGPTQAPRQSRPPRSSPKGVG